MKKFISVLLAVAFAPIANAGLITESLDFTSTGVIVVDSSTATSSITIADTGSILSVGVSANISSSSSSINPDGTVNPSGGSHFGNELALTLTSPSGTLVELVSFGTYVSGSSGFDVELAELVFEDGAALQGGNLGAGIFAPTHCSLGDFIGESASGNWILAIIDSTGADPKSLNGWQLNVVTDTLSAPEPSVLALFGIGLLGLSLRRRKRA